jgi:hypothetical protein
LYEQLFDLYLCGSPAGPTRAAILSLCENWWLSEVEHRESLIANCLHLLTLEMFEAADRYTAKICLVRIYKLRHAYDCIDLTEPSSDTLGHVVSEVFKKWPGGRDFVDSICALFQESSLAGVQGCLLWWWF